MNDGGALMSIDNGQSFYEALLSKFGARKYKWRFFKKADLSMASKQFEFGVLSSFSFETRLGIFGHFLDNYIVYPLDWLLFKIFPHNPTMILSIFKKPTSAGIFLAYMSRTMKHIFSVTTPSLIWVF